MNKKKTSFLLLLFVFSFLLLAFFWWQLMTAPVNSQSSEKKVFIIKKGEAIDSMAGQLKEAGLIKSIPAFKLALLVQGISREIQAGSFRLSPQLSLFELTQELTRGRLDFWVTIPEGLRLEEVAEKIAESAKEASSEFDKESFIRLAKGSEGYLFPDTYLVTQTASPSQVLAILKENFEQKYSQIKNKTNFSQHQILVLASLIEREAKHDADRPIIAGILAKRLENDWQLQIDATIQYLVGYQPKQKTWWKKNLTKADLKIESAYNTYQRFGLPPDPICNPGLASLKAAANPEKSPFWFYLADSKGQTHFAETLEGHNQNIRQYLTK